MSRLDQQDRDRLTKLEADVDMLKRIVYGATGVVLLAVLMALLGLVMKGYSP